MKISEELKCKMLKAADATDGFIKGKIVFNILEIRGKFVTISIELHNTTGTPLYIISDPTIFGYGDTITLDNVEFRIGFKLNDE